MLPVEVREKWDEGEAAGLRLLRVPEDRIRELREAMPFRRGFLLRSIGETLGLAGSGPGGGGRPGKQRDPGADDGGMGEGMR